MNNMVFEDSHDSYSYIIVKGFWLLENEVETAFVQLPV